MSMTTPPPACPVCESTSVRARPFGYRFNGRWLGAVECRTCRIIFIHPQPTVEELARLYSREYFEGDFRCGHAGSYFDERNLSGLADQSLLERIRSSKPSGRLLEVGCAGGAFLHAARDAGYEVAGVEFSAEAAAFARDRFDLHVVAGELAGAKFPPSAFDIVFMGDVLEHLPDPVATLDEIHRVLRPDALLVIHCPMQTNTLFSRAGFLAYSVLGKQATVQLPPYHLFEYRPDSIRYLLRKCRFEITILHQGAIGPKEITLRGSNLQRIGKKVFQYPNSWLTRTLGVFGDRVEVFANKRT